MSGQPTQAQILAALSSGGFKSRPPPSTSLYSELRGGDTQLVNAGSSKNARKIYCFRQECGSLILSAGAGDWVRTPSPTLPHDPKSPFPSPDSTDSSGSGLWHVPTPFDFENVGYSRPDSASLPPSAPGAAEAGEKGRVKWLICAECDLGPIGYGFEGGKEAWIDAERVRYASTP